MEQAAGTGAYRLAVVRVDRLAREDHRTGAGRVGRAQHRARVARVPYAGEHRDQPRPLRECLRQRHVDRRADRDQALRRDGLGEDGEGLLGHRRHPRAGGVDQVGVPVQPGRRTEQFDDGAGRHRLPYHLGSFGEELARLLAVAPPVQPPGGNDPGRPLRERLDPGS
jgi:hypothetical protein